MSIDTSYVERTRIASREILMAYWALGHGFPFGLPDHLKKGQIFYSPPTLQPSIQSKVCGPTECSTSPAGRFLSDYLVITWLPTNTFHCSNQGTVPQRKVAQVIKQLSACNDPFSSLLPTVSLFLIKVQD